MGKCKRASLCHAMLLWFKEGRGAVTPSGRWSEAERLQCSESGYEEQFYTVEIPRRYIAGWQEGLERKTKVSLALRLSQLCGGPHSLHHGRWWAFGGGVTVLSHRRQCYPPGTSGPVSPKPAGTVWRRSSFRAVMSHLAKDLFSFRGRGREGARTFS